MAKFSKKFERLVDFIQFTHEFQKIVRIARRPYGKRLENDAEHSYQLAMVAWFLIDQEKLKLNKERCLMYALAHDVVEVYAGDTPIFKKEKTSIKHEREKKALLKIKKRFPYFTHLTDTIEQYERKRDKESIFIYALDKILPPIQIYLEKGKLWHEYGMSYEDLIENKNRKIVLSKNIDTYWQELLKELKKNKKKLFSHKK